MRGTILFALGLLAAPGGASAQGYPGDPYAPRPRSPRGASGYNCEAVQVGITGAAPFSCPLPGPRPLGVRCFCGQPAAAFSGVRPPLPGLVVP